MSGNYPAGVTDNDPHFRDDSGPRPETESQYQTRMAKEYAEKHANDPVHDLGCQCEECVCPY